MIVCQKMTNILFSGGMSKSQKKKSAKKKAAAADTEINKMLENTHVSNNRTGMVYVCITTCLSQSFQKHFTIHCSQK